MRAHVKQRARGTDAQDPVLPAWITAGVNEWGEISSSSPPYGMNDYSGLGFRDDGSVTELFCALGGGHNGNVTVNSAHVLDLTSSAPAWSQVKATGDTTGYDDDTMTHFPADGSPGPRHLYNATVWCENRKDYVFGGRYYAFDGSDNGVNVYDKVDGFNRTGNSWRAAGYYPARQETWCHFSVADPATGILYATEGDDSNAIQGFQIDPTTLTMSTWHAASGTRIVRGPNAWDTTRGNCFQLGPRNYEFWSGTIVAATISTGGTKTAISFNSSSAYTTWSGQIGNYLSADICYDPTGDKFYWYNGDDGRGASGSSNRVFVITPNGTTTWDMSLIDGTGLTPPATRDNPTGWNGTNFTSGDFRGTNKALFFVDRWGVLILARRNKIMYMRVR